MRSTEGGCTSIAFEASMSGVSDMSTPLTSAVAFSVPGAWKA